MQLSSQLPFAQLLTKWTSTLNPFLKNPLNQVLILKDVKLVTGVNIIDHLLQQTQQGWFLVDIQNPVNTIYRSQPFNDKTLVLTASASATVSIGVF